MRHTPLKFQVSHVTQLRNTVGHNTFQKGMAESVEGQGKWDTRFGHSMELCEDTARAVVMICAVVSRVRESIVMRAERV